MCDDKLIGLVCLISCCEIHICFWQMIRTSLFWTDLEMSGVFNKTVTEGIVSAFSPSPSHSVPVCGETNTFSGSTSFRQIYPPGPRCSHYSLCHSCTLMQSPGELPNVLIIQTWECYKKAMISGNGVFKGVTHFSEIIKNLKNNIFYNDDSKKPFRTSLFARAALQVIIWTK